MGRTMEPATGPGELAREVARLREEVRARDQLLSAIAHDLKNPLTSISADTQMLTKQVARLTSAEMERVGTKVARLEAAAARLGWLIDDLLDVARLQSGRELDLDRRPTDLVALVHRTAEQYRVASRRDEVEVVVEGGDLVGAWDPGRLERVLVNVLDSARRLNDGGGLVVRVARECEGERVTAVVRVAARVEVVEDELPRVPGTGVGLPGARRVLERHGGTLVCEGGDLVVRLPLVDSSC